MKILKRKKKKKKPKNKLKERKKLNKLSQFLLKRETKKFYYSLLVVSLIGFLFFFFFFLFFKFFILEFNSNFNRFRHLLKDFHKLLPHCKKGRAFQIFLILEIFNFFFFPFISESKLDAKTKLYLINEIADMNLCNNCIFFETRKKEDLYIWFSRVSQGPSVKFYAQNGKTIILFDFI